MRQVLVLGGTAWLGREIARAAIEQGAEVTCLARGSAGEVAPGARLVRADRAEGTVGTSCLSLDAYASRLKQLPAQGPYAELLDREWDDVIEISYDLGMVRGALAALAGRAKHWTLVSSVSVYADVDMPGADETARLVEPTDLEDYAHAKVAAENATMDAAAPRALIARPGLIVGPGDASGRFGYWPGRFAAAAAAAADAAATPAADPTHHPVLVPDTRGRASQVIDVRDLADWIVRAGAAGTTGMINAVGDVHELAEVLDLAAAAAGFTGPRVEASDAALIAADVQYWAGPHSLPLWLPQEARGFMRYKNSAYRASGGTLRPLAATIADVRDDERALGPGRPRRSGLTREEELAVIAGLDACDDDRSGNTAER